MNSKRRQLLGVLFPAVALLVLGLSACSPSPSSGSRAPSAVASTPATSTPSADPSPSVTPSADGAASPTSAPSQPSAGPSGAIVTIITASLQPDGIEVTGIAPGQNDPAARCTATATKGTTTVSSTADVTVTNGNSYCPLIVLDRAGLSSGTWQVVLGYDGSSASGRSDAKAVVVP